MGPLDVGLEEEMHHAIWMLAQSAVRDFPKSSNQEGL